MLPSWEVSSFPARAREIGTAHQGGYSIQAYELTFFFCYRS
jgi:hypothetical protein